MTLLCIYEESFSRGASKSAARRRWVICVLCDRQKRWCSFDIAFQLCFTVCRQEGSGNPGWLEIKWYTSVLIFADNVNKLGGSVHTIQENAETWVVASKEIGLEVNADKTKHMIVLWDKNAGRRHTIKIDNSSFDRVDEFIHLGTTLTNPNSIQEENKGKLWSGNACYHLMQNLLSSSLLSKNLNIKNIQNYNFVWFVWEWNLVADIVGGR
jgi:hypothetical protein